MATITIKLPTRRTVLLVAAMAALSGAIVGAALYLRGGGDDAPASTVVGAGTPANVGCIDEPGTETKDAGTWYSPKSAGVLRLTGELISSLELGFYTRAASSAVGDVLGHYATSEVRDVAPTPTSCVTLRFAGYEFDDGSQVQVMAWRTLTPANPQSLPNEAAFQVVDDTTLVSQGPHAVTVLVTAPDGTTVMVAAYGRNALAALTNDGITNTIPTDVGGTSVTPAQLTSIGNTVLVQVLRRERVG